MSAAKFRARRRQSPMRLAVGRCKASAAAIAAEREACAAIALAIETEGNPELFGDPDVPTPITRLILARNDRP